MSRNPRIDSPCPMRWTRLPEPGRDFCSRCQKRVHNLDAMSSAERLAFLSNTRGSVCVAYSVPGSVRVSHAVAVFGVAAALAMTPGMSVAADPEPPATPPAAQGTEGAEFETIVIGGVERLDPGAPVQVMAGRIGEGSGARHADEPVGPAPELPVVEASAFLETGPGTGATPTAR